MRKILTVSVAAYNIEKYIKECLDSLTVAEVVDELEVFVIDDGSTDNTIDIVKRYSERYPDTFIIVQKENGGWGSTMNYSITHATGKYLKFLDGDDWFDADGLIKFVSMLKSTDVDIVITTKICKGPDIKSMRVVPYYDIIDGTQIKVRDLPKNQVFGGWYITYKTDVVRKSKVYFPLHRLYTDQYYFTVPFAEAKDLLYLDCVLYCYRVGREGQSISREQRIKHLEDALENAKDLCAFCEQMRQNKNENIKYIMRRVELIYINAARTILLQPVCNFTKKQLIEFDDEIKNICLDVYTEALRFNSKTALFLRLLKETDYAAYWLLKLLPGGAPNFN